MANNWFIEESMPDGSFRVIKRDLDEQEALELLTSHPTGNRLEMWSYALADSPKGFAPAAFRHKGQTMISNTLKMLCRSV